jgi:hypothetical protein
MMESIPKGATPAETRRRAGYEPGLTHDDAPFRCPGVD